MAVIISQTQNLITIYQQGFIFSIVRNDIWHSNTQGMWKTVDYFIHFLSHKQNLHSHACHVPLTAFTCDLSRRCILLTNWGINSGTGANAVSVLHSCAPSTLPSLKPIASCMIVHFAAHILKWQLVCKFGVRFHILIIISCLGSRFHAWN